MFVLLSCLVFCVCVVLCFVLCLRLHCSMCLFEVVLFGMIYFVCVLCSWCLLALDSCVCMCVACYGKVCVLCLFAICVVYVMCLYVFVFVLICYVLHVCMCILAGFCLLCVCSVCYKWVVFCVVYGCYWILLLRAGHVCFFFVNLI